jgi:uncharacterized glyoxalase superfamily protein PhnB
MANVKPIPDGFHTITPYLVVQGGRQLIEFLKNAFGAREEHRSVRADGTVWHAQLQIGDSKLMLADGTDQHKPYPASLYLYVEDVDAAHRKAVVAGGTSVMEPATQFYGDRNAGIKDPSGNTWWISTHVEDVSPEEMERRTKAAAETRK